MSMAQELDYTTLKWVKEEIQESLRQTRQALEAFVENPEDITQIRFCTTYLHQVYGTLQMVEIYGAALLAEEMERISEALADNKIKQKDNAYDVLMRAILQLPAYLEHIEQGHNDEPVILLPLLNDLRSARGENLLSDNAFFSPNLDVKPPPPPVVSSKKTGTELKQYVKKLRTVFQVSLIGLYRDQNVQNNIKKLAAIVNELHSNSESENAIRFWWVASGVLEALLGNGLERSNPVKLTLGQLDKDIKRVMELGEQAFEHNHSSDMLKTLLYYVATAKSAGARVTEIKNAFKLNTLVPSGGDINQAFDSLRGSSADLLQSVSAVIKEDLLHVKDDLDLFVRNRDKPASDLIPLCGNLDRISDTLVMLGFGDLRKIIQEQVSVIGVCIEKDSTPNEQELMGIASALLYIESSLDSIESMSPPSGEESESIIDQRSGGTLLPQSEQRLLAKLVISQAADVLLKVKESFNTYANDTTQLEQIQNTPEQLFQVKGVLAMLTLNYAADILQSAITYIKTDLITNQQQPSSSQLDAVADIVSSIEYYLEAVADASLSSETLLESAAQRVAELGYSVEKSVAETTPPATTSTEAVEPDTVSFEYSDTEAFPFENLNTEALDAALEDRQTVRFDANETKEIELPTEAVEIPKDTEFPTEAHEMPKDMEFPTEAHEMPRDMEFPTEAHEMPEDMEFPTETHEIPKDMEFPTEAIKMPEEPAPVAETTTQSALSDNIDEEILEIFIEEADEVFVVMKERLAAWRSNTDDSDSLDVLRRSYHTIKGSGRLAGAIILGEFAWSMENVLNHVIEKKLKPSEKLFVLLEESEDILSGLIEQLKASSAVGPNIQPYVDRAQKILQAEEEQEEAALPDSVAVPTPVQTEQAIAPELPTQDALLSDIFKRETHTHISSIRNYISEFQVENENYVDEDLMRALHTLHGSARMAEAMTVSSLCEALDRYFRTLHDKELAVQEDSLDVLSRSADIIDEAVKFDLDTDEVKSTVQQLLAEMVGLHETANIIVPDIIEPQITIETATLLPEDMPETAGGYSGEFKIEANDDELKSIFLDESKDIIKELEKLTQRWTYAPDDIETMQSLQRVYHRLKGGAAVAGMQTFVDFGGDLEDILKISIKEQKPITTEVLKLYQSSYDWLTSNIANYRNDSAVIPDQILFDKIQAYLDSASEANSGAPSERFKTFEFDLSALKSSSLLQDAPESSEPENGFDEDEELRTIFLEEANEILEANEIALTQWHDDIHNIQCIEDIQRKLHTLKGGARMAKVPAIGDLSHEVESLLESVVDGSVAVSETQIQLVQTCHDWLALSLLKVKKHEVVEPASNLIADLLALRQQTDSAESEESKQYPDQLNLEQKDNIALDKASDNIALEKYSVDIVSEPEEPEFIVESTPEPESTEFTIAGFDELEVDSAIVEETDYDEELVGIFLEEALEIQEHSGIVIALWKDDIENREHLSELQRVLHTLKGGARMANITTIGDVSHAIESLLEAVTQNRLQVTNQFPLLVQLCHDWLSNAIEQVKAKQNIYPAIGIIDKLDTLLAGETLVEPITIAPSPIRIEAAMQSVAQTETEKQPESLEEANAVENKDPVELIDLQVVAEQKAEMAVEEIRKRISSSGAPNELIRVKAGLIDNLVNFAGETNIYNSRIGQQMNAWHFNLAELNSTVQRIREQLRKFEIETEAQIMYRHATEEEVSGTDESFDPLELDRFSYMQQLSRSMAESLGDLSSIEGLLHNSTGEASVLLLQQSRVNSELQEGLMKTRMTPFSSISARLQRIVRQTTQETGKQARLSVVGAEGEMDRTQLNRIVPALEHILRNAIDHGIESVDERQHHGKTTEGHIEISLEREGSEMILRISDDGAGFDIDRIREKAKEKGLLTDDSTLSESEIMDFILQSGFSTVDQVTQISGRGIGMDVVNTEIKQLNGSLHIDTKPGQGSTFTIRLPLTVLVNQALLVAVADTTYAIQLTNIEHVIRVSNKDLELFVKGKKDVYEYAGHEYQYLNLGYLLHNHNHNPKSGTDKNKQPLLLGRSGEHRVAMQIDQLVGRQEIVIKSVGPQLSQINYISGATILPDGEVALILDIGSLIRRNIVLQQLNIAQLADVKPLAEKVPENPTIMIVDDSITVRKVTERLLKRHKFEVITAKDGLDALTVLFEQIPDIMLLDVEMPRMDGYELATAMRADDRLKHIPIIMITSRTGDKHRDRALEIGVNKYMGKPYQENELLENIHGLLDSRLLNNT